MSTGHGSGSCLDSAALGKCEDGIHKQRNGCMALTRKTRISGSSIVVTIPSQLVEAFDINSGDLVEIVPLKNGEIKIKKIDMEQSSGGIVRTRN